MEETDKKLQETAILALKRIEGQVRGIQKMISGEKECVEILNQIQAVIGALARIEDSIIEKHFEKCITRIIKGASASVRQDKMKDMVNLIKKIRRF